MNIVNVSKFYKKSKYIGYATPGRQKLPWTQQHQAAFVETKNIARKPMALSTPIPGQGYTLETDTLTHGVGHGRGIEAARPSDSYIFKEMKHGTTKIQRTR